MKIKIGFGPETTANSFYQSGVKVARELNKDDRFEAGIFKQPFSLEELSRFDVLVFIKILPPYVVLKQLKEMGKKLILDYQDMFLFPTAHEQDPFKKFIKTIYYFKQEQAERKRLSCVDACFVSSPESERVAQEAGLKPFFLFRQIYNDWHQHNPKVPTDKTKGLTIVWTGVGLNIKQNKEVEPILDEICKKHNCRILYLTDTTVSPNPNIEYRKWNLDTWEKDLLEGDIAFRWYTDSNDQRHKDSNKIISYMAAGLPVVCKPTSSDRNIIKDGETGFFANNSKEFGEIIEKLILNPDLRSEISLNAHKDVWSKYSLEKHANEITDFISKFINSTNIAGLDVR